MTEKNPEERGGNPNEQTNLGADEYPPEDGLGDLETRRWRKEHE